MNRILPLLLVSVLLLSSCSQKVYFFEADKLENSQLENIDIKVNGFFAGDALDYVVFELDVINNTSDSISFDYKDIYLKIDESEIILPALNKNDVIHEVEERQLQLKREKRSRDIGNAISIGLDLLLIGSGNINALDAIIYSTETAAYMLEDSRAHKLMKGSLEEQIQYLNDWIIHHESVPPLTEDSWDVLFDRQLFDTRADLIVEIEDREFAIPFQLKTIEEKVR